MSSPDSRHNTQLSEKISHAQTFKDVLEVVFGARRNLRLLEIGAGYGDFVLALNRTKQAFGIETIVASDKDTQVLIGETVNGNLQREGLKTIEEAGIMVRRLDVKDQKSVDSLREEEPFDIVVIHGPVVRTDERFLHEAITASEAVTRKPGVMLVRFHSGRDDGTFDPRMSLQQTQFIRIPNPHDFPNPVTTESSQFAYIAILN